MGNYIENHSRGLILFCALGLIGLMATAPLSFSAETQKCQARLTDDSAQAQITCNADAPVSDETAKTDAS